MSSWYSDHPVVSTVLWLMGSSTPIEEKEQKKPTRCLSWRDEHDGSPIAEYMTTPQSVGVKFSNDEDPNSAANANSTVTAAEQNSMGRKKSLPALPRSDSDVDKYAEGKSEEDLMSPQWGWYVSTTPPQEQYGQRSRHA